MPASLSASDRERIWRERIAGWKRSGQTVRAYCATHGLREPSFYHWRRTLADRDRGRPVPSAPAFAAVRVVADPVLEVVLPAGLVVRVPVGTDPAAVARLVSALGGPPC